MEVALHAQVRTEQGRHAVKQLRTQQRVPAVLYGHGIENRSLTIPLLELQRVYAEAGESSLIDVHIGEEKPVKVIIQSVQRNPLSYIIDHIDLHQVRMDEKLHAEVELHFTGEAPAVKELGGILVKNITHVQVECLPTDLPHGFSIDISVLKTFDDTIRIKDLVVAPEVSIVHDPEDSVVSVAQPRSEEELAALNETVVEDVSTVEVTTEKPSEGEEGEEEQKTEEKK